MTAITLKAPTQGKHDSSPHLQILANKCFACSHTPTRHCTRYSRISLLTSSTHPGINIMVSIFQLVRRLNLTI